MSGYTPDEKLRLQQLRELRRRWLKDQELSPREPVLPPRRVSPVERFWNKFLQDGALWKNVNVIPGLYSAENHSSVVFIFGVSSHFLEAVVKSHQLWVMNTVSQNSLGLWLIIVIYKTYRHSIFAFTHVLIPVWIIHYYLKYHVTTKPYTIVEKKPRIFPGDTILETGEVIPPMKEFPDQHH